MSLHTMIGSWQKSGSVNLLDVTPADLVEDFGISPDPERAKLGDGFLLLDTRKKLAQQNEEMVKVVDRADLTCVQKQVFFQHIVEGKPLVKVSIDCGGETFSLGCLKLALETVIEILSSIVEEDKENRMKEFVESQTN